VQRESDKAKDFPQRRRDGYDVTVLAHARTLLSFHLSNEANTNFILAFPYSSSSVLKKSFFI
jgi:hypothetical protein